MKLKVTFNEPDETLEKPELHDCVTVTVEEHPFKGGGLTVSITILNADGEPVCKLGPKSGKLRDKVELCLDHYSCHLRSGETYILTATAKFNDGKEDHYGAGSIVVVKR